MKKLISFFTMVFFLCVCNYTYAQVNTYTFSQNAGTYTEIVGDTTVAVATTTTTSGPLSMDDTTYPNNLIPFTFTFNGSNYDYFNITSNGFITFGGTSPAGDLYTAISGTTAYNGAVSSYSRDLIGNRGITATRTSGNAVLTAVPAAHFVGLQVGQSIFGTGMPVGATIAALNSGAGTVTISANATASGTTALLVATGSIVRGTTGTVGSRVHTIQFKNVRPWATTANANCINFQIKLYETTNKVEIVYGTNTNSAATTGQVGLRGSLNTDFNNRNTATAGWATTIAGTANTNTLAMSSTITPASGVTFVWTPPAPPVGDDMGISAASIGAVGQVLSAGKGYDLTATAKNFGTTTQNVVPVYYTVNGGTPVGPVNTVGPIVTNATENVVFSGGNAVIFAAGVNVVKVYTALAGDASAINDTLTLNFNILAKISTFPHTQNFTIPTGWTFITPVPVGSAAPWFLGLATNPDGVAGDAALGADFFGGTSSEGRVSILRSPEMDFSGVSNPVADFYVAYRSFALADIDRIQVLVSTDGGLTFNPASTPYDKTLATDPSLATLGISGSAYTPTAASEWRHETVDLSNVGNLSNVVVGFVSTSSYGNNFWLDNFIISQPNSLCTDVVAAGGGTYSCNSIVSLNFTATPVPPLNGNQPTFSAKTSEKSSMESVGILESYEGSAVINSGNQTDNPNGGTVFVSQYTNNDPGQTIAPNATATAPDGSISTPTFVYSDFWFTITYDGNDQSGYATYDISMDITGAGFTIPNALYIVKRTDNTGAWVCQNTTLAGNILTVTGLTDFSDFALAGMEALPVELSSFVSSINGSNVTLNWSTASEINNSGFDIERSSVSGTWSKVGNVTGNGTSATTHSYTFTDRNLASGNYSYRLKQVDFNGNFEYHNLSNEVIVGIPVKYDLSQNYPNPFNPSTKINYALPTDGQVSIKIFDMAGKEVMSLVNEVKTAGYYSVNFNASNLSSGIYFYSLSAADFTATKKMMLVK